EEAADEKLASARYRLHSAQTKARRLHETIRAVLSVKHRYWRRKMSPREKCRMMAERCLLCLPQPLVLSLVRRTLYRDRPLPPPIAAACTIAEDRAIEAWQDRAEPLHT
ncbi:MAG TPA: hypothetical protein PK867_32160, partial [Pirellulales bacterium]|nr:hypothetical protein [Pirellulales bacterium]